MRPKVRTLAGLALLAICGGILARAEPNPVPSPIEPSAPVQTTPAESAADRVAGARAQSEPAIREAVQKAGLAYPPREIFLRAFKREAELEVWAREDAGPFRRIKVYPVLASSGEPGPKRRQGDLQVPEGCYTIAHFNPLSRFHLSLGLDYPNESDRVLSDPQQPGSDIYIHGSNVSIGCLPLGDASIEELFLLASDTRQRGQSEIAVHLFPARMTGQKWERFSGERPDLQDFWAQLQPIYEAFERTHLIPKVTVATDGRYVLSDR